MVVDISFDDELTIKMDARNKDRKIGQAVLTDAFANRLGGYPYCYLKA